MSVFGVIAVIVACLCKVQVVRAPGTVFCLGCPDVMDPASCTQVMKCHSDIPCATDVFHDKGHYHFNMHCKHKNQCLQNPNLFGKRRGHHTIVCSECCTTGDKCNKDLCHKFSPSYVPNVTTAAPTPAPPHHAPTMAPTLAPSPIINLPTTTPVNDPNCRDHEEDGIGCAQLDLYNFCTDTSLLGYVLVRTKCPKHCGICHNSLATTSAPVTPPPNNVCADYEQDGISCANLDLFNLCTDTTSILSYVVAHEKCRKHCGFCHATSSGGSASSAVVSQSLPQQPSPASSVNVTAAATSTQGGSPQTTPSTSTSTQLPQTTAASASTTTHHFSANCFDIEDANFSCADWASKGYCSRVPGTGYEIAKLRCRKTCNYC